MALKDIPIRQKLMTILLLTSGAVLLLTCASFFAYEFLTFRQSTVRQLSTIGEIVAANSTAALAFDNQNDAKEILSALQAERHIVGACLYHKDGKLFSQYPSTIPAGAFPPAPEMDGFRFAHSQLAGFQPVMQNGRRLGTLYLRSDMGAMYERFRLYGAIALLVIVASLLFAYLISRSLQRQISRPILALAETAKSVSDRRDYSVRATKLGQDELGLLTDAFNQMLMQIQEQNQALSESEARVRAVLNSALTAVFVIDAGGKILDWNARAESMFGWTRREALGLDLAQTIIPPNHREAHRRGIDLFLATGEGVSIKRLIEMNALRRDGTEFPVEFSLSPLKTGNVVTFCGFITDITQRKQAETKLQEQLSRLNLLQRITHAIGERQDLSSILHVVVGNLEDNLAIDFTCVCVYEPTAALLTVTSVGAKSAALAKELGLTELAQIPIDQNGLARCVRGELVYEPDMSQVNFSFPRRLQSGGLRSLVVAPLLVESNVFGVLVAARRAANCFSSPECEFLRQLSEHVALAAHQAQINSALQQAYNDLRQSQQTLLQQERLRALGQMASGIAHDINNAISPVALYTESLLEREPNLSARARDYLTTIQNAIEDVTQTVARMREFYRRREPELTLAVVHVERLIQQVLDLTRARWNDMPQGRGLVIRVQTEVPSNLPAIMGAESEIRDALTNLILNAVDAMPHGGVLTIRARAVNGPVSSVVVEVSDTGVGMDEETKRRCLEPFFTTKGERGTGLGLAMVYGMVERHSAELEVDSKPGQGTTIRLIFAGASAMESPSTRAAMSVRPVQRLRILLMDDDPLLIKSLRDTLEGDGHVVTAVDGGQAGINAFEAAQQRGELFAVVITDLGMPYVDGRKVAASIKARSPATPVILLTGWGQRLEAEGDIPPHVDRVLNKPPQLRALRAALAEVTSVPEQSRSRQP